MSAENSNSSSRGSQVGVFIGGTSGVGEASAYAFARHLSNPTVYVIGRNSDKGAQVVNKLQSIQPSGQYEFIEADMTLLNDADRLSHELKQKSNKINVLSVSCGAFSMTGQTNQEGLDGRQTLMVFGRWRVIDALLPLVNNAAEQNETARVNVILSPVGMKKLSPDGLEMRHNAYFPTVGIWASQVTNLLVMKYASIYPKVTIMNTFPGVVAGGMYRGLPGLLQTPTKWAMSMFAESADKCGERMHQLNYGADVTTGPHLYGTGTKDLRKQYEQKGYLTFDDQTLVYNHLHKVFDSVIKNVYK